MAVLLFGQAVIMIISGNIKGQEKILTGGKGGGDSRLQLSVRERTQGEVLGSGKNGEYLVRLKGSVLNAKSTIVLPPGKTYLFEAESLKPVIELKTVVPGRGDGPGKESFLKSLNLPADALHLTALKLILLSGAIPAKEDITSLVALFAANRGLFPAGVEPDEALRILFLLNKLSLPVNGITVEAMLTFARGEMLSLDVYANLRSLIGKALTGENLDAHLREMLTDLESRLAELLSAGFKSGEGPNLARLYSILGLLYEKQLHRRLTGDESGHDAGALTGLKEKLLNLLSVFPSDGTQFHGLLKALHDAVGEIEKLQVLRSVNIKDAGWNISFHLLHAASDAGGASLPVIYQRKEGGGERSLLWKLFLSLDLESTGAVRLVLSGMKKSFSLHIISENDKFTELLKEESAILPELVGVYGYQLRQVSVSHREIQEMNTVELLIEGLFASEGPVDMKV